MSDSSDFSYFLGLEEFLMADIELSALKNYVDDMSGPFGSIKVRQEIAEIELKNKDEEVDLFEVECEDIDDEEKRAYWESKLYDATNHYEKILCSATIILLFSILERCLIAYCKFLREKCNIHTSICQIKRKRHIGITDAVTVFLKDNVKIDLPKGWGQIEPLTCIRNAIVHNNGVIRKGQLEILVDQRDELPGVTISRPKGRSNKSAPLDGWTVHPSVAYCKKAIDLVTQILQSLEDKIRD